MANTPMNTNNLDAFSIEAEGHYFDRKSARIKPVATSRHIIAFANASGGKLAIGIEDDGTVTGFKRDGSHAIEEFEQASVVFCSPTPTVKPTRLDAINAEREDDAVLVLDIALSKKHVIARRTDGAVFLREGAKSLTLDRNQVRALEQDKGQISFEDELLKRSSIDDVDPEAVERYRRSIGARVADEQLLRSRGFLVDGKLTNAGAILFASTPTLFLPSARIRVLKVEGTDMSLGSRLNVVKDRTFEGPLARVIDDTKTFISSQLREFQFLGKDGKFKTLPEYPEFAWFEGLVNAAAHRDYSISGEHTRIILYDDRVEITSPGHLPNIVDLDNMGSMRYSRNPSIARALIDLGWVRELNEGVRRMRAEMSEMLLPEPEFSEPNGFSVKLVLRNNLADRIPFKENDNADPYREAAFSPSDRELTALGIVQSKGHITTSDLVEAASISRQTASTTLKGMTKKGLLTWHGTSSRDPSQYYTAK